MIKILIVDDEKIERNGICFLLKQLRIEAEVLEAVNGVKALEVLKENSVDILITDIKMPFMDGLTLIKNVVEPYPDMKIIIFSGYGEFEYAKKAMMYHVNNYILKPVDPKEFETTLKKVIQEIEAERLEQELHEESIQFFKEHILLSLMNGMKIEEILKQSENLISTDFLYEYHCMMLLEFDKEFFGRKGADFVQEFRKNGNLEFQYVNMNQQQSVLLFGNSSSFDRREIAEKLQKDIYQFFGEKCYIAVSEYSEEPLDLQVCYEKLENLMENKFYLLDSNIFLEHEESESESDKAVEDDLLMKQIRQDIKVKDMVGLRTHFDSLCEKYKGKTIFSQMYVKFVFSNLMKDIYDILPNKNQSELNQAVDKLYRANDFSEVTEILQQGIEQLEVAFSVNPQMMHREIETVKAYIYANYDKELSVDMLAEQVYMAPSYLSHIFKKETGQNLSKFIKALRMEKAKEMLTQTHNKIVNISYAVGYPNVSYFCQSFREYFGVSPQKYRNQGEENDIN